MASITKQVDKSGETVYKIRVSGGLGRRVTRSLKPNPGCSARTTERELQKFAATLENELASRNFLTVAEEKEQKKLADIEAAKIKTLRQYVNGVFMPTKEATFSENARSNYRQYLENRILPALGDIPITDITSAMLSKFFIDMQRDGYVTKKAVKRKGKPDTIIETKRSYSLSTLMKCYVILQGVFKMAYLSDTITRNPMDKVPRPKLCKDGDNNDEREKAYTIQEMQRILQCLENKPLKWRVFIKLLADTGIRRGEACGLMWSVEKSRTVQNLNTQNMILTQPDLWRSDGTLQVAIHRDLQYRFSGDCNRS